MSQWLPSCKRARMNLQNPFGASQSPLRMGDRQSNVRIVWEIGKKMKFFIFGKSKNKLPIIGTVKVIYRPVATSVQEGGGEAFKITQYHAMSASYGGSAKNDKKNFSIKTKIN